MPLVSVVCYQAVVSATDRSFIQKSPTECDVCVCVCVCVCVVSKFSAVRSPWSTRAVEPWKVRKCIISLTFHTHIIRSWHIGLPPPTATQSIFSQVQYALYLLIRLLSEELTVLVILKLVSKRQEI